MNAKRFMNIHYWGLLVGLRCYMGRAMTSHRPHLYNFHSVE